MQGLRGLHEGFTTFIQGPSTVKEQALNSIFAELKLGRKAVQTLLSFFEEQATTEELCSKQCAKNAKLVLSETGSLGSCFTAQMSSMNNRSVQQSRFARSVRKDVCPMLQHLTENLRHGAKKLQKEGSSKLKDLKKMEENYVSAISNHAKLTAEVDKIKSECEEMKKQEAEDPQKTSSVSDSALTAFFGGVLNPRNDLAKLSSKLDSTSNEHRESAARLERIKQQRNQSNLQFVNTMKGVIERCRALSIKRVEVVKTAFQRLYQLSEIHANGLKELSTSTSEFVKKVSLEADIKEHFEIFNIPEKHEKDVQKHHDVLLSEARSSRRSTKEFVAFMQSFIAAEQQYCTGLIKLSRTVFVLNNAANKTGASTDPVEGVITTILILAESIGKQHEGLCAFLVADLSNIVSVDEACYNNKKSLFAELSQILQTQKNDQVTLNNLKSKHQRLDYELKQLQQDMSRVADGMLPSSPGSATSGSGLDGPSSMLPTNTAPAAAYDATFQGNNESNPGSPPEHNLMDIMNNRLLELNQLRSVAEEELQIHQQACVLKRANELEHLKKIHGTFEERESEKRVSIHNMLQRESSLRGSICEEQLSLLTTLSDRIDTVKIPNSEDLFKTTSVTVLQVENHPEQDGQAMLAPATIIDTLESPRSDTEALYTSNEMSRLTRESLLNVEIKSDLENGTRSLNMGPDSNSSTPSRGEEERTMSPELNAKSFSSFTSPLQSVRGLDDLPGPALSEDGSPSPPLYLSPSPDQPTEEPSLKETGDQSSESPFVEHSQAEIEVNCAGNENASEKQQNKAGIKNVEKRSHINLSASPVNSPSKHEMIETGFTPLAYDTPVSNPLPAVAEDEDFVAETIDATNCEAKPERKHEPRSRTISESSTEPETSESSSGSFSPTSLSPVLGSPTLSPDPSQVSVFSDLDTAPLSKEAGNGTEKDVKLPSSTPVLAPTSSSASTSSSTSASASTSSSTSASASTSSPTHTSNSTAASPPEQPRQRSPSPPVKSDQVEDRSKQVSSDPKEREFQMRFNLPAEILVDDYSCAVFENFPWHGRMFISKNYVCFYSNVGAEVIKIPFYRILGIEKNNSLVYLKTAIELKTENKTFFFTSFLFRDRAHGVLCRLWAVTKNLIELQELAPGTPTVPSSENEKPSGQTSSDTPHDQPQDSTSSSSTEPADKAPVQQETPLPPPPAHWATCEECEVRQKQFDIVEDVTLNVPAARLFQIFYSDEGSQKLRTFYETLGDSEIKIDVWEEQDDHSLQRKIFHKRKIEGIGATLGGSQCTVHQTQKCYRTNSSHFAVSEISRTSGVLYCENWELHVDLDISSEGMPENQCRFRYSFHLKFIKWTVMKTVIEPLMRKEMSGQMKDETAYIQSICNNYRKSLQPLTSPRAESAKPDEKQQIPEPPTITPLLTLDTDAPFEQPKLAFTPISEPVVRVDFNAILQAGQGWLENGGIRTVVFVSLFMLLFLILKSVLWDGIFGGQSEDVSNFSQHPDDELVGIREQLSELRQSIDALTQIIRTELVPAIGRTGNDEV